MVSMPTGNPYKTFTENILKEYSTLEIHAHCVKVFKWISLNLETYTHCKIG